MNDNLIFRRLEASDYEKGFIDCINELTTPKDVSKETFLERLKYIDNNKDYHVVVVYDKNMDKIVGSGTLFIEHKFIRGCVTKGHIEDVVVISSKRGSGIGKEIVKYLINYGKEQGVYKISLVCNKNNVKFYEKCGLSEKEVEMVIYTE